MATAPPSAPAAGRDSQTCTLPDGRTIGFAEYGAADGQPVLYFHGFPSSRLEGAVTDQSARRHKVRILALDRPGFGLSTPLPGRRIVDWPDDVQAFAAAQGLARVGVLGCSGGGPYALACARQLPASMLTHVGVFCGTGAWDKATAPFIPRRPRIVTFLARSVPWALRALVAGLAGGLAWLARTRLVASWVDQWLAGIVAAEAAKKDKAKTAREAADARAKETAAAAAAVLDGKDLEGSVASEDFEEVAVTASVQSIASTATTRPGSASIEFPKDEAEEEDGGDDDDVDVDAHLTIPERREKLYRALFEPFIQGPEPTVQEALLLFGDFGYQPDAIAFDPVVFWHGGKDENVPLAWAKPQIDRVPHSVLHVYPGRTHTTLAEEMDDVMAHFSQAPKERPDAAAADADK